MQSVRDLSPQAKQEKNLAKASPSSLNINIAGIANAVQVIPIA